MDRYGPLSFTDSKPMDVAPHPHMGLQTVSWLLEGEVLHRDSLGFESLIRPGELNVMTSGHAIAHSEETPGENTGRLSGVQLWVALPDAERHRSPGFEHHAELPRIDLDRSGRMTLFIGTGAGRTSPATAYSPMIGAEITIERHTTATIPLERSFEHAILVLDGASAIGDEQLVPDTLYYLGTGRDELPLRSEKQATILLVGGEPFGESIVMWWNFVARTHDEIERARTEWENRERFGEVSSYRGSRLAAPPLKGRTTPPPAS